MRTTVNIDEDVLAVARAIAETRGVSIGKALSDLARKGAVVPHARRERNGFYLFEVGDGPKTFGPDEVDAALEAEELPTASYFVKGHR